MTLRERITGVGARRMSLYLTIFVTQLGTGVAVPILPELREHFGVTIASVSLVTALWGLARLVLDLPLGGVMSRFSTGRALFVGVCLLAAGAVTSAAAPTFEILLLGRIVSGGGAAVLAISSTLALLAMSTPANRGRVLGIYQVSLQAGASLGPVVAGIAAAVFDWRAAFLVAGLGAFGGLAVLLVSGGAAQRASATGDGETVDAPRQVRRSPVWLDLLLANFATFVLFFLTGGVVQNVLPLYGDGLGLDAAALGLILSIATGLRMGVSIIGSVVSDRRGRHGVMLIGFVLIFAALLAFPLADSVLLFVLLTWLMGVGRVGNTMPIAVLSDRLPDDQHSRWISRNRFIADLALLVAPIALGIVIDAAGFDVAFYVAAVMVGLVLVLMLLERRAHRQAEVATASHLTSR